MRLLFALCVAVGFGAMLVGSAVVAPRSPSAPVWSGAVLPVSRRGCMGVLRSG
jgi:hypothetical protein